MAEIQGKAAEIETEIETLDDAMAGSVRAVVERRMTWEVGLASEALEGGTEILCVETNVATGVDETTAGGRDEATKALWIRGVTIRDLGACRT